MTRERNRSSPFFAEMPWARLIRVCSARRRSTTLPSCTPTCFMIIRIASSGSAFSVWKNSSTPATSRPTRIGKAKAALSPRSCTIRLRGKFVSILTSGTQIGAPPARTRPGRPTPPPNVRASLIFRNGSKRSGPSRCHRPVEASSSFSSILRRACPTGQPADGVERRLQRLVHRRGLVGDRRDDTQQVHECVLFAQLPADPPQQQPAFPDFDFLVGHSHRTPPHPRVNGSPTLSR